MVDDVTPKRYREGQPVLIGHQALGYPVADSPSGASRTMCSNASTTSKRGDHHRGGGPPRQRRRQHNRGTDIVLGGNVDFLTDQRLRERGPGWERLK